MAGSREAFCTAVDTMMEQLASRLHSVVGDLLLKLYNCFEENERQEINVAPTHIEKVEKLLTAVKTKSVDIYERFLTALVDCKHEDLAEKLRNKWSNPVAAPSAGSPSFAIGKL